MIRVAILSFSDGRPRVHESLKTYIQDCEKTIRSSLEKTKEVEIVGGKGIIHSNETARNYAVEVRGLNVDACILNIPVFAFPNFSAIAANLADVPLLAIAPVNGSYPGLGGLQAAVNFIRQLGLKCEKIWGNIGEPDVLSRVMVFLRAAHGASTLKGQIYGLIGGRSIGMGTGAINPDSWLKIFGVDVDHIDQLEIIRLAEEENPQEVQKALKWITGNIAEIRYDNDKLTPETLAWQIRCYMATNRIIQERGLSFVGVKCHYELSEHYCTQCIAAAFCNDPYDWNGAKEPVVYSCEADGDGALTMQILKLITGRPVLFMDFRHYNPEKKVFAFCNCGSCATWYANRSNVAEENLKKVRLFPIIPKYAGKGSHVQFIAKEGEVTFARLCRTAQGYKLQAFLGCFADMHEKMLEETCPVWPHGFTRVTADPFDLVQKYESNHIHGAAGNFISELRNFCELKGIEFEKL